MRNDNSRHVNLESRLISIVSPTVPWAFCSPHREEALNESSALFLENPFGY